MKNEIRGCRPFPVDLDRQRKVMAVLDGCGMTITELAGHIGMHKQHASEIILGRRLTSVGEEKIAAFLGYQRFELFPQRTARQIAEMRAEEAARKEALAAKKNARMEIRRRAIEGAA